MIFLVTWHSCVCTLPHIIGSQAVTVRSTYSEIPVRSGTRYSFLAGLLELEPVAFLGLSPAAPARLQDPFYVCLLSKSKLHCTVLLQTRRLPRTAPVLAHRCHQVVHSLTDRSVQSLVTWNKTLFLILWERLNCTSHQSSKGARINLSAVFHEIDARHPTHGICSHRICVHITDWCRVPVHRGCFGAASASLPVTSCWRVDSCARNHHATVWRGSL